MKKKQNELLKCLLAQNKALTSTELANTLKISTRSVKNYVSEINDLYNKKIILSSRNGYEINTQMATSLIVDKEDGLPQTGEERAFYIIKQLILEHTSHLDLFDLCDNLYVSYSTIKGVIAKMNKIFSSYNVEFVCENDCVRIIGDEKSKRKLISYVIYEDSNTSYIDNKQLKECFSKIDIDKLTYILNSNFKNHGLYLNDFAAINMLLHLVILIDREMNGNPLESGTSEFTIKFAHEQELVNDLCNDLEKEFHIHLNKYEQFEIYMLFKANVSYSLPTNDNDLKHIVGNEVLELTNYYIKQINSLYMIDLSDEAFSTPFSLHLKNLLFRLKAGRYTINPMAEAIKLNSPIVFDIAIFIGLDIMERYNVTINEDELAFLAMHIGSEIERQNMNKSKIAAVLLCPDYHNMSAELLNKLLLNFGNQIKFIKNVHTEEELKELDFRILFTTIPISSELSSSCIYISPFNLSSQYDLIQDTISREQDNYKNYKLRTNFHSFFEEDLFVSNLEIEDKDDILHYLCDKLYKKNYTEVNFEEKIFKRENAATTAFKNIAIPHSMDMDAIKTSIAVAISKKGFIWDNNTVHLVLLLAINKADKKTFREL
ncbi:MAG: PRD domain-containing protein, partial [Coprobacillus sp.]